MGADLIVGGRSWKSGDTAAAQVMRARGGHHVRLPWRTWPRVFPVEGGAIVAGMRGGRRRGDRAPSSARRQADPAGAGRAAPPSVRDVMQARRRGAEVRPVADLAACGRAATIGDRRLPGKPKPGAAGGNASSAGEAPEAVAETVRLRAEEAKRPSSPPPMLPGFQRPQTQDERKVFLAADMWVGANGADEALSPG
ncbi:MAG: hypothetical protein ACLTDR_04945 [Adlercreutzia equolifaciens]